MDGTKIHSIVVEKLHFLDPLKGLPISLKSMPKSFDLTCKKGNYLHFSNTAQNLDYSGPYPEPKFYGADYMSGDERAQFLEWYYEQKDKMVSNKQELLAYCMGDINIMRQACCAFRNLVSKFVNIDPFRQAITISSICNEVFRTKFLKPDSVGIILRAGYRMGDRQTVEALQSLAYISRTHNNVSHAGNIREVHLPGVTNVNFDGYCAEKNEVF